MKHTRLSKLFILLLISFLYTGFLTCLSYAEKPAVSETENIDYHKLINSLVKTNPFNIDPEPNVKAGPKKFIENQKKLIAQELSAQSTQGDKTKIVQNPKALIPPFKLEGIVRGSTEFVVVKTNYSTEIVRPHNSIKGWTLVKLNDRYADFKKIKNSEQKNAQSTKIRLTLYSKDFSTDPILKNSDKKFDEPFLTDNGSTNFSKNRFLSNKITLSKANIISALKNKNQILSNISLRPHVIKNQVRGFKLSKVNHPFISMIGLKKGDILEEVNNTTISSINSAKSIAKSIFFKKQVDLKIRRMGKIETLTYFIK